MAIDENKLKSYLENEINDSIGYLETETTAQRHRLALSKAGWFAREKLTLKGGRRMHMTYLGKDEVWESGLAPKGMERPGKKTRLKDVSVVEAPKASLFILPGETTEKEN